MSEVIDVDYEVLSTKGEDSNSHDKGTDITINADPYSAAISGIVDLANHITDSVKEYNMCKQQEKTKREAIKAQMKVEIEKIETKKEICLKYLDMQHEENMRIIADNYEKFKSSMVLVSNAVQSAIKLAEQTGDFSEVCELLDKHCKVIELISDIEIKQMQARTDQIQMQNSVAGFLK